MDVAERALQFLDAGQVTVRATPDGTGVAFVAVVDGRGGRASAHSLDDEALARAARQATLHARQPRAWPTPVLPPPLVTESPGVHGDREPPGLPDGLAWNEWTVVDERIEIASTTGVRAAQARAYGHGVIGAARTDGDAGSGGGGAAGSGARAGAAARGTGAGAAARGMGAGAAARDARAGAATRGMGAATRGAGAARTVRVAGTDPAAAADALALLGRGPATPLAARVPDTLVDRPRRGPYVFGPDAVAASLNALRRAFGVDLALDPSRLDTTLAPPGIEIADDALALPAAFDAEGTPRQRVLLVEDGVLRRGVHDASSAAQAGTHSTGHATMALTLAPQPDHLTLDGGTAGSVDELIERAGSGLYVPALEPIGARILTRGAAAIAGGRVTGGVADHAFTLDAGVILASIIAMTSARRAVCSSVVPALLWG